MSSGIEEIASWLLRRLPTSRVLVAIDGPDGSGKTTFAARLAARLSDRPVIVVHVDGFLNRSEVRHARGRFSPEGFWRDSYNYEALRTRVLDPLRQIGPARYRPSCYDPATDTERLADAVPVASDALVLVEGLFLHRDELVDQWDASIFLDVPFAETARRMSLRDGSHANPEHPSMRRYVDGQRIYYATARPWERATLVVDNSGDEPRIIDPRQASALRG
ncbi:MAG: uridine kinase [Microlunatus sp.]